MKPFSLTTVLKYRQQLEDTAATRLVIAQRKLDEALSQYKELEAEQSHLITALKAGQIDGMRIEDLVRYEDRLFWLEGQVKKAFQKLTLAKDKVKKERENVLRRSREKKVLEQLKEKQDKNWKQYLDKKEMAQLDEIAVLSHERKEP